MIVLPEINDRGFSSSWGCAVHDETSGEHPAHILLSQVFARYAKLSSFS